MQDSNAGTEAVDVQAIVRDIQDRVAAGRAAGKYPADMLEKVSMPFDISRTADPPEVLSLIQVSRPIRSTKPVVGPVIVLWKKVLRRLLAWYVSPVAEQQTRFNDTITRELRALQRRVDELEQASRKK